MLFGPGSSSTVNSSCYLGAAGDVPLALDLLPGSPDDISKLGSFRYHGTAAQSMLLYVGGQLSTWCDYSTFHYRLEGTISTRVRVFVVGDKNYDELPEILHYDQESGAIKWYVSPNCDSSPMQVTLGNGLAVFL